jgi:hypothetical protein
LCIKMLSFSISYWDLIKFPYFPDTTERGDRGWNQRVIFRITLSSFKTKWGSWSPKSTLPPEIFLSLRRLAL